MQLTEDQNKDIETCKSTIIGQIEATVKRSDSIKNRLTNEVFVSLVYIKIFAAYLKEQNFTTLEEAWRFMNDIKGIVEKVFYVSHYCEIIENSIKEQQEKK